MSAKDDATNTQSRYADLLRALVLLGIDRDEATQSIAQGQAKRFARQSHLPPILTDLIRYDDAAFGLCKKRLRQRYDGDRLRPLISVPHCRLRTRFPILSFVTRAVDDPFMLSERECDYLLLGNTPRLGVVSMSEIHDRPFFDALLARKPLEDVVGSANNLNYAIETLSALAKLGVLQWRKSRRQGA